MSPARKMKFRIPPPRPGRRERRSVETRERLYRAALQLFAERGFQETTVEDITEAADVGKGTFFNYFETKEHVLAAFGGERIAAVERALEQARATKGPVLDVLGDLAVNVAGQSKESPALLRAIYAAHATSADVRAQLQKRMQMSRRLLAEIFTLAQLRGEVRRDLSALDLARRTQIVFVGVTLAWAVVPDDSISKRAGSVWEIFRLGLVAPRARNRAAA
jgi:AcrR family transcriptional regulator